MSTRSADSVEGAVRAEGATGSTARGAGGPAAVAPRRARRVRALAALAGVLAAALTVGVAELIAVVVGPGSAPVLAIGSAFVDAVPAWLKDLAISLFGTNDKAVLLASMWVVIAVLAAVAGLASLRARRWGTAVVAALGLVAVGAALTRASAGPLDAVPSAVGFAVGAWALALLVDALVRESDPAARRGATGPDPWRAAPAPGPLSRASFLALAAGTAVAAGASAVGGGLVGRATRAVGAARAQLVLPAAAAPLAPLPAGVSTDVPGVTPFTTPNADFYRIDTALTVPQIDPATWSLRIHGLVDQEVSVSFADLLDADLVEADTTLTCVSNEVGGDLVGHARWLGLPLHTLLERAGVQAGADMVLSRSSDGFSASTPLEALTDPARGALLAIGMNGEPLPLEHGFPARMVVPGLYGYVSATKWVVELEVTRFADVTAYWTDRGWSERGPIKTASRVDVPAGFARLAAGPVAVAGVAWAQTRGIEGVEVQVDDGPWAPATLAEAPNADTWRQWSYVWDAAPGNHTVRVRATDGAGEVQTAERARPAPDGSTGLHAVDVVVA